jgi:hypothetical protein
MKGELVLDFDGTPEVIACALLYDYPGPKNLALLASLEAKADTRESTLADLGDLFPRLEKLRLDDSAILSVRDIGCSFAHLTYLSLKHCGITSLNGISTLSRNLEELYLAFNAISDLSDLIGMDRLRVLDLEANEISDLSNLNFLKCCPQFNTLTLTGNPAVSGLSDYVKPIQRLLPQVAWLDGQRIQTEDSRVIAPPLVPVHRARFGGERPPTARVNPPDVSLAIRQRWSADGPQIVRPLRTPRRGLIRKT